MRKYTVDTTGNNTVIRSNNLSHGIVQDRRPNYSSIWDSTAIFFTNVCNLKYTKDNFLKKSESLQQCYLFQIIFQMCMHYYPRLNALLSLIFIIICYIRICPITKYYKNASA